MCAPFFLLPPPNTANTFQPPQTTEELPAIEEYSKFPPFDVEMAEYKSEEHNNNYQGGDGHDDSNIAGKIFVGGLSWQTTVEGLRYYFEK